MDGTLETCHNKTVGREDRDGTISEEGEGVQCTSVVRGSKES